MLTIPTLLTLFRIALIPVFILAYYSPIEYNQTIAAGIFVIIAITDWLDGYLARSLNQSSSFGAFLDPVADKIAVAVALILLVESYTIWWVTLPAIIIIARELAVSALREWLAQNNSIHKVAVNQLGKAKTTAQLIAIVLLIIATAYPIWQWPGLLALQVAALLTIVSMLQYFANAWQILNAGDKAP